MRRRRWSLLFYRVIVAANALAVAVLFLVDPRDPLTWALVLACVALIARLVSSDEYRGERGLPSRTSRRRYWNIRAS